MAVYRHASVPSAVMDLYKGVEECDDGDNDNDDICLTTCKLATCGDGFIRADLNNAMMPTIQYGWVHNRVPTRSMWRRVRPCGCRNM